MSPGGRRLARDLTLAAVAAVLVGVVWSLGVLRMLDRPAGDLLVRLAHRPAPAPVPVAAVVIDDAAVARDGALPWPRRRLAALVDAAWNAGARGIVVDMLLTEDGDEEGDRALAAALARGPAVLAAALVPPGGRWLLPLPRFGGGASAGHVHADLDPDGVVRTIAASKQAGGVALPALSVAGARILEPTLATAPGTLLWPDFEPPPTSIPEVSADALLHGEPPASLAGRLAFLGVTATGATDQLPVPTGGRAPAPGVLVHASAASSLVAGGLLHPVGLVGVVLWSLALGLGVQLVRSWLGRLNLAALAALAAVAMGFAALLLRFAGSLAPPASLLAAVAVAALVREADESRTAQRTADRLLQQLEAPAQGPGPPPRDAATRLALVRRLQAEMLRDRALRATLLEGLDEGVVLWDDSGAPLLGNAAANELWGALPSRGDVTVGVGEEREVERRGRTLEVRELAVTDGSLGLFRDVTERRELERRRAEVQRLVSHELRTPLASLAGFGRMLERYQLSPEELSRVAGLIRREAERLGRTVSSFLDLERLAAGALAAEREPIDLAGLVCARVEVLAPVAAERDQEIRLELADQDGFRVHGSRSLLERVVDNLVGNALKHPPSGTAVAVKLRGEGARTLLTVHDEGPGIPAEALPHLFDRFYRAPGAGAAGSGLGLALVAEAVRWHGGEVTVTSGPGQGTTFGVELPTAEGDR